MPTYWLALRNISAYTAPPLLLGVFDSKEKAKFAVGVYCDKIKSGKLKDRYKQQGFREEWDLLEDCSHLISVYCDSKAPTRCVVVAAEGFGQISVGYHKAILCEAHESDRMENMLNEKEKSSSWPGYSLSFDIELNELRLREMVPAFAWGKRRRKRKKNNKNKKKKQEQEWEKEKEQN